MARSKQTARLTIVDTLATTALAQSAPPTLTVASPAAWADAPPSTVVEALDRIAAQFGPIRRIVT
jgi:hypothetical protein